jgi:NAD(P)-dependent dehydrogenase (short-subunit alcohol dehydrogenase family)
MTQRPSSTQTVQREDPRESGAKPPYPEQQQPIPGSDDQMSPRADHGEESYVGGSGRLAGLVAVVTGGDSGIGRAVALAFAREGADVVVSYLNEEQDARETVRLVEESGRRTLAIAGDISDEAHCRRIVDDAVREFGRIDILVNNAAFQKMYESIEQIPSEEWRHTFATNIDAMFYLCKAAIPHMQPGASIINTASVEAFKPEPQLLAYATTKGAIVTFSKALAQELAKRGIRVNVVAPGPIWTPLIPATFPEEKVKTFGANTPLKRPGQPNEVAPSYLFLACEDASYITGSILHPNGGDPTES